MSTSEIDRAVSCISTMKIKSIEIRCLSTKSSPKLLDRLVGGLIDKGIQIQRLNISAVLNLLGNPGHAKPISRLLRANNASLLHLVLHLTSAEGERIEEKCAETIAAAVGTCESLRSVQGTYCSRIDYESSHLMIALGNLPNLETLLAFDHGVPGPESKPYAKRSSFWRAVGCSKSIRAVSAPYPRCNDAEAIRGACKAIAASASLWHLQMALPPDAHREAVDCYRHIACELELNTSHASRLASIVLTACDSDVEIAGTHLLQMARAAPRLRLLRVPDMDAKGLAGLAQRLLDGSCQLEELHIHRVRGKTDVWEQFGKALATNQSLRRLEISSGSIKKIGVESLATALQTNVCLEKLKIPVSGVPNRSILKLLAAVGYSNETLTALQLAGRLDGNLDDLRLALARALEMNASLTYIYAPMLFAFDSRSSTCWHLVDAVADSSLVELEGTLRKFVSDWPVLETIIRSNCTLRALHLTHDFSGPKRDIPSLARLKMRQHVPRYAPGLASCCPKDSPEAPFMQPATRPQCDEVLGRWLYEVPQARRAACMLRMTAPSSREQVDRGLLLDVPAVAAYATRALEAAVVVESSREGVIVAQVLLEAARFGAECARARAGCVYIYCQPLAGELPYGPGREEDSNAARRRMKDALQSSGLRKSATRIVRGASGGVGGVKRGGVVVRCVKMLQILDSWAADRLVRWRRAVEAKRDAGMVFQAARDGRPLELGKRLRLGVLAGGLDAKGLVDDGAGGTRLVSPLEAARLGEHEDCVKLLR